MTYSATAIANAILDIGRAKNAHDLSPMKLQKLVYFAHGWHSAVTDRDLINEQIEAWQYGPVVPSIYEKAKKYGNSHITGYLGSYESDPSGRFFLLPDILSEDDHRSVRPLLDWIWGQYGHHSGIALSNITHLPGTPWSCTVEKMLSDYGRIVPHTDIPREQIKDYFKQELNKLAPA